MANICNTNIYNADYEVAKVMAIAKERGIVSMRHSLKWYGVKSRNIQKALDAFNTYGAESLELQKVLKRMLRAPILSDLRERIRNS